ncbi:MGMT family protein [Ornithinimicrobium avium]|uniref:Cysteine methyltransferase n=1 Tax=Ornithinimicrobium avium TaxID=2283195 RepID=A0A345NJ32_9MICO|nr:MGMT family protein [Ornithinimicrobium avium]AXH95040.1 cysteine methyltransferase [Ornithinimicrobium avium]
MDEVLVERVLRAVEQVPPGRVVSYGDLAALVGTGPRQVGAVMRHWGAEVTWWRVTSHAGDLRADLLARARPHWDQEGIEVRPDGRGCPIAVYRADLVRLGADYAGAVADLEDAGSGTRSPAPEDHAGDAAGWAT